MHPMQVVAELELRTKAVAASSGSLVQVGS
jgi:hypothetical protein